MENKTIYYVSTETDGKETPRLVRADSKAHARSHALSIVTVRKANQADLLLAIPPNTLLLEDAD
jgi:hypothetical protein